MERHTSTLLDRALETSGRIVGVVLLLRLAWAMVQPILLGLILLTVLIAALVGAIFYYRNRW
jgi:hypothetical protein